MAFPADIAGPLGGEGEAFETGGAVGDFAGGEESGEAVLDSVVLASVVGLPAKEAGGRGEADGADGFAGREIEKVAGGIVVAGVAEVVAGGGFEDAAQEE